VSVELTELTIAELAPKLAARELSPVELTEAYLDRIGRLNEQVCAYVTVTAERARADARAAERELRAGQMRGPLHGIPIGLKDLYHTAGILTTGCSRAYLDHVPSEDAPVVSKLREAGMVMLGKLAMHELATGAADPHGPFPRARNPCDLARTPAGSSTAAMCLTMMGFNAPWRSGAGLRSHRPVAMP